MFGPTGSGKSTLAKKLGAEIGIPVVSTGAIAREQAEHDPHTSLLLQQGEYAPEGAMRMRVKQMLEEAELTHGGWVLDGFPRTLAQWVLLCSWLKVEPMYIEIEIRLHQALNRLRERRRDDDIADAIEAKVRSHQRDTQLVIDMLREDRAMVLVNGTLSVQHQYDYLRSSL